jgi:hypothetical protein
MVRFANELDILRLAQLAKDYSTEVGNHDYLPFDLDFSILNMSLAMSSPANYCSVLVKNNNIVGFLWATATQIPWSKSVIVFDNILYIEPSYRGGLGVVDLIKHYEKWCKSIDATCCSLSTASGISTDRVCALFKRIGYSPVGYQFRKELI